jgi:hypothetical protein
MALTSHEKSSVTWFDLIEAAATTHEVLDTVRDYLESWDSRHLEALPPACRPPVHFIQPEDVVNYAFEVVRHHCGSGSGDANVALLAAFFGNAARRIAVLMGDRSRPRAANEALKGSFTD